MLKKGFLAVLLPLLFFPIGIAFAQSTPDMKLREAAYFGRVEVVRDALSAGADVNNQDENGYTALMWAAESNREDIAQLLLENGADVSLRSADGRDAVRMGKSYPRILALLKKHDATIPAGYVVAGEPVRAPAAPAARHPPSRPAAANITKPAAQSASATSATVRASCKRQYAHAYALCGASRDCKFSAAVKWESCEATGRWP